MFKKLFKKEAPKEIGYVKVEAHRDTNGTTEITIFKGKEKYTMFTYKALRRFLHLNSLEIIALDKSTHNLLNATRVTHSLPVRAYGGQ